MALAGGLGYDVPTGRRDGLRSDPNDVINLPVPQISLPNATLRFTSKGLTVEDMVVLMGAHTVGEAHCTFFRNRLFNFKRTGKPDPTMDPSLRGKLQQVCGKIPMPFDVDPTAFLDQNTSMAIDNRFYSEILKGRGVLQFDQKLALDNSTSGIVTSLASDEDGFLKKFADALVKLGNMEVLVGGEGEIRSKCGAFNAAS